MERFVLGMLLVCLALPGHQDRPSGVCMISNSHNRIRNTDSSQVMLRSDGCDDDSGHCGNSNDSGIPWSRWTGVSQEALQREGAQLDAHMSGEAGDLHCNGTVHDGVLAGKYEFTVNTEFLSKMEALGFDGITPSKQEGFLLLDVTLEWVKQLKDAGVTELSTNKLMGLRALHVDADYVHALSAAGYPELRANKLTEMKAVGVTPEKVQEAKSLGFHPTEQELVQICVFKIDRAFVERMRARGLTDLTLHKLIQIKIFKLED